MSFKKIAIHGVPRAGTSWLGAIFDSSPNVKYNHQPLFAYKFKSYLSPTSSSMDVDTFFDLLLTTTDDFINQTIEKKEKLIPVFQKEETSHVVYKEARYHHIIENLLDKNKDIIIVAIIRNPKSVLYSWFNAPKEFDKEKWKFSEEWLNAHKKNENRPEEFYGYLKWKEFTLSVLKLKELFPDRVCIVNYKKLLEETEFEVRRIFDFCGMSYSSQTNDFIKGVDLENNTNPYSVFKSGQTDDKWIGNLPLEVLNYIDDDLNNSILSEYNL